MQKLLRSQKNGSSSANSQVGKGTCPRRERPRRDLVPSAFNLCQRFNTQAVAPFGAQAGACPLPNLQITVRHFGFSQRLGNAGC
jgi:hypothetical protein